MLRSRDGFITLAAICRSGATSSMIQNDRPIVDATQIAVMDLEVGDRRGRQILLQRLPVLALIERDVRALERARVEQSFLLRILAHDVHRLIRRDAVARRR